MKNLIKITLVTLFFISLIVSCIGKTTADCKGDVRAYEFGREMYSWVELRSAGLSLNDAINEYSDGMGINHPYESSNPCVDRGYNDAKEGIESPYNKNGKSWTTFD
jgi:hypothetical protein